MAKKTLAKSNEGRPPGQSQVEMTQIVLPQHTNALGTVFGGVVMSWIDIAAATCAMRHSNKSVVTASIDAMHFLAPIKLGWIVTVLASVNYTHKSSCEVGVKVKSENPLTQEAYHTASAYLTMVSLDSHGKPSKMVPVVPESGEEKARYNDANLRRQTRLKLREELKTRREGRLEGSS